MKKTTLVSLMVLMLATSSNADTINDSNKSKVIEGNTSKVYIDKNITDPSEKKEGNFSNEKAIEDIKSTPNVVGEFKKNSSSVSMEDNSSDKNSNQKLEEAVKKLQAIVKKNTETINKKCNNVLLKKVAVKLISDVSSIKEKIDTMNQKIDNLKISVAKPFQVKPKCVPHKELNLKKSSKLLKGSFKHFKTKHSFVAKKTLKVYPLPEIGVSPFEDVFIKKGTKFKADSYTYAGWIHTKEGWLKGYLLKPIFLQQRRGSKKHSVLPVFKVVGCKTK